MVVVMVARGQLEECKYIPQNFDNVYVHLQWVCAVVPTS